MSESPIRKFASDPLGAVFEDTLLTAFFGNKNSVPERVALSFPDYKMSVLRQTHSDIVIRAPFDGEVPEGDAQITRNRRLALCVRTADCVPVLIHDPDSGFIAAIHAGWRGVENEIVRKTGATLLAAGATLNGARAWIGPHIGVRSFEVSDDVALKLEARLDAVRAHTGAATVLTPHLVQGKKYVDLLTIVRAQLGSIGIEPERRMEAVVDTFVSPDHESFRRDREKAGRQISFISLK